MLNHPHLQRGSQPSLASHTSSCSGGTVALMYALCCRYALMQASLSDIVSSPNSHMSHHLPTACTSKTFLIRGMKCNRPMCRMLHIVTLQKGLNAGFTCCLA